MARFSLRTSEADHETEEACDERAGIGEDEDNHGIFVAGMGNDPPRRAPGGGLRWNEVFYGLALFLVLAVAAIWLIKPR